MPINDIRAIELFTKAVELGSIRRAASVRGISAQAASKSLAVLEARLGVRLLHRTTRGIALTAEGEQFLDGAGPALAALERAVDRVRTAKDDIAGPLRVVARVTVSCRYCGRWSTRSAIATPPSIHT